MDTFLKNTQTTKLTHEEIKNLNRSMSNKKTEFIAKNNLTCRIQEQMALLR